MPLPPPPTTLDNADVLYWLPSDNDEPFYYVPEGAIRHPIMAMAICRYPDTGALNLFKCDCDYTVQADWDCGSVEEAMEMVEKDQAIPRSKWRPINR